MAVDSRTIIFGGTGKDTDYDGIEILRPEKLGIDGLLILTTAAESVSNPGHVVFEYIHDSIQAAAFAGPLLQRWSEQLTEDAIIET